MELSIDDTEFTDKTWQFMTATATPAPFLILRQAEKKQYPWEWTPEQVRGEPVAAPSDDRAELSTDAPAEASETAAAE